MVMPATVMPATVMPATVMPATVMPATAGAAWEAESLLLGFVLGGDDGFDLRGIAIEQAAHLAEE